MYVKYWSFQHKNESLYYFLWTCCCSKQHAPGQQTEYWWACNTCPWTWAKHPGLSVTFFSRGRNCNKPVVPSPPAPVCARLGCPVSGLMRICHLWLCGELMLRNALTPAAFPLGRCQRQCSRSRKGIRELLLEGKSPDYFIKSLLS